MTDTGVSSDGGRPMVLADRVCKNFGALQVLKGVSIEVQPGEVACLIGPSGSGKSTFLRCVNHLEKVNAGRLEVDGELIGYRERGGRLYELSPREAARQRRDIGMVFQHFNLFPHRTALENIIEAPVLVGGKSKSEATERALDLLSQVGLRAKADAYPAQLSGGQQQRVAIARALVGGAPLILADEPTGNLDTKTSDEIMDLFENLNRTKGITIILVTHEPDVARYSRRVVTVRDGLIVSDEPMEKRTEIEKEGECA